MPRTVPDGLSGHPGTSSGVRLPTSVSVDAVAPGAVARAADVRRRLRGAACVVTVTDDLVDDSGVWMWNMGVAFRWMCAMWDVVVVPAMPRADAARHAQPTGAQSRRRIGRARDAPARASAGGEGIRRGAQRSGRLAMSIDDHGCTSFAVRNGRSVSSRRTRRRKRFSRVGSIVRVTPIPVELCVGGRDLTEPRLSPDGALIGWAESATAGVSLTCSCDARRAGGDRAGSPSSPPPRAGRGLGGGCWCWMPDRRRASSTPPPTGTCGITTVDGDARASAHRPRAARRAGTGRLARRRVRRVRRRPDGGVVVSTLGDRRVPSVSTTGPPTSASIRAFDRLGDRGRVAGVERAGHAVGLVAHRARGPSSRQHRAPIVQPAARCSSRSRCPTAACSACATTRVGRTCGSDDAPLVDEPFEHAGPTWGLGQRSFAVSPDGRRVAFTRNETGFGRLCVVDVSRRGEVTRSPAACTVSCRGRRHRDRRAAHRRAHADAGRRVRRRRRRSHASSVDVGPDDAAGREVDARRARARTRSPAADGDDAVHARLYRADDRRRPAALLAARRARPTSGR